MNQLATRFPQMFCSWLHKHKNGYLTNNTHNCVLRLTSDKNTHAQQKYYWFRWSLLEYFPAEIVMLSYTGPVSSTLLEWHGVLVRRQQHSARNSPVLCCCSISTMTLLQESCGLGCHQHRTLVARELAHYCPWHSFTWYLVSCWSSTYKQEEATK